MARNYKEKVDNSFLSLTPLIFIDHFNLWTILWPITGLESERRAPTKTTQRSADRWTQSEESSLRLNSFLHEAAHVPSSSRVTQSSTKRWTLKSESGFIRFLLSSEVCLPLFHSYAAVWGCLNSTFCSKLPKTFSSDIALTFLHWKHC